MIEIKAPNQSPSVDNAELFLAGSIEMGLAENWQKLVVDSLADFEDLTIFNPRRDDWDSSWEQTINNPQFKEQVTWELENIEMASVVFFYFDPKTLSPISLMELGMVSVSIIQHFQRVIVVCPEGFWRKGNIEVLCDREGIELYSSLEEGMVALRKYLLEEA